MNVSTFRNNNIEKFCIEFEEKITNKRISNLKFKQFHSLSRCYRKISSEVIHNMSMWLSKMYSKYRIYMRVFRICVILPIERVEKIRDIT